MLDGEIGIAAAVLSDTHGDAGDRIIVSIAVLRGMTLITADESC